MAANRTPISNAASYSEIGEYWDSHELTESGSREVAIDVDIQSSSIYFRVEKSLAERLRTIAHERGRTAESLLNEWVEEHVGSAKR